jgi:hypothetical protein
MAKIKERRRRDAFAFIDRRRGKFRMYGQIVLCAALIGDLIWLLR